MPHAPQRSYLLVIDVLEGFELPVSKLGYGMLVIQMGPYIFRTEFKVWSNGRCEWYESLKEKKVVFPTKVEHIPDLIVYYADDNDPD